MATAQADVEQVHISMNNNLASIVVTWLSTASQDLWHAKFGDSADFAGAHPVTLDPISNSTYQYSVINATDHSCYAYDSPSIYRVEVSEDDAPFFKSGATVYYKIFSDQGSASDVFSFKVPHRKESIPVKLAIIGDLGQTVNSTRTVQHVIDGVQNPADGLPYDAAVICGDLSYADAENLGRCSHPGGCDPTRWDSFGRMLQPLGAILPIMTTPGNHEIELVSVGLRNKYQESPRTADCKVTDIPFLEYRERYFHFETEGPTSLHYSWDIGNVHNIMINSYSRYVDPNDWASANAAQYKWLEADLAHVDRAVHPWILVHLHAPWYNSNSHHRGEPEETEIMASFEPLLHKFNVDVLFAGHVHSYERTYPVLNGGLAAGPSFIEINIGDGGNREGPALPWCEPISEFPWSAYRDAEFGHGTFQTFNNTHARWTWQRNNVSESDPPGDDVWLVKSYAHSGGTGRGFRVYDAMTSHLGEEWVAGRQHDHVEDPVRGRRETRRSYDPCPTETRDAVSQS
eukprot:CAMPEP_0182924952 /NCGR_PEP_ID=MMETSP0105_2-20130417/8045_1 /TAXON_ID=81532 ORGANISM="Acanthoeca-like sp., Strain 10tr" /NCGR_SAMPLE_ID=MMETSP0105_2 /ASSEMBLY_ACC=CAM_ASM_000205 /LENGTH=514 /DNA_ID=CAMNT_0025062777 /DNA_START=53 /DNA_END=1597 /DNA_ORIENTATION=+